MTSSWTTLCHAKDLHPLDDGVEVVFSDDRKHKITVEEQVDAYLLKGIIVRQSVVFSAIDLPMQVWQRNRITPLIGFRIDKRGRLVGEAMVPKVGLTKEEFQLYLRAVASECDRFEYALTGRDVE